MTSIDSITRQGTSGSSSMGAASAALRAQEGLSQTLQRTFDSPDSATCQVKVVEADARTTFDAILTTDFASSRLVMLLTRLRALPEQVISRFRREQPHRRPTRATVDGLIEAGYWVVLENRPPQELALGLSMWDRRVEAEGLSITRFHAPGSGAVQVGWSFCVERLAPERSLLITETRAQAVDVPARRRFRRYWRLISPFASLTRRLVLDAIAAEAERHAAAEAGNRDTPVTRPDTAIEAPLVSPSQPPFAKLPHGLPCSELQRIAADPSDPRCAAAERRLEIRARRDAMCSQQLAWDGFDVVGETGVGTGAVGTPRSATD